nr:hypothetical protein [Tanacetum cinerariifolium]
MLNKENYVPWSSRFLRYAKSRPNGKLIHNSIINGPYTYDELSDKELKQIEADYQAIKTILLGLPKDINAAIDSCETAQEIWLRVQQMMKGSDIGIQEKKANNLKFLNNLQPKWSRHEVDELKAERLAKIQDPLALIENSNNPYAFPAPHQDQPSYNQNYMQQPMPNLKDIADPTTVMNMALALMAKAFKVNYSTPTNNNQRISSNPCNRQIAQPGMNMGQDRQMQMVEVRFLRVQNIGNQNGLIGVPGNANQNLNGNGNLVAAHAEGNAAGHNGNQIRCYNCRGQASTSGTQSDKAPVYDSDGSAEVIQICLWCVSSGCSKHMTGNLKLLINFVWNFMGTVRFRNDHVAAILDFGDLQWGDILITRVYFIEGLGHNLFSIGQFCDSDLEVAFRRNACFHQRLSHLNFDTINDLARNDFVSGLPKFKYHKEHLWPLCEQGKSKIASHPPKLVPNSRQRLHLLHMDLCGPMRIASINGKRYVLVIVDDYSGYTWVHFLRSKDEAPDQQNGVVKRQNRTLVEAARTMLIFSRAPLFLWAEVIATTCFTQNRSIIYRHFNKTPYELINGIKADIFFLHVFEALCYPKNDHIGKLGAKGDIGFFISYSADSCAYRIYNRRTKKIMETMNVSFDELLAMDFEQRSSKPGLQSMTSGQISSGLDLTYAPSTITSQKPTKGEFDLLFEAMYDDYIGDQPSATARTVTASQEPQVRQTSSASTSIADTAPTPTNSSSHATNIPLTSQDVDEHNPDTMFDGNMFVNPFANPSTSAAESSSSYNVDPSNMYTFY